MSATDDVREAAAAVLWEADQTKVPIAPLTETWPELDVVDAYEIQRANIRRRLDAGARVRGHKVGLSAKAMQDMLGVHEPDYGHLLDDMFCYEHDTIPMARFCQPRAEIEVAFVLGRPLEGPGVTVADVRPGDGPRAALDRDRRLAGAGLEDQDPGHGGRQRVLGRARARALDQPPSTRSTPR